jgi:SAM-dependent methyltransferase
MTQVQQELGWQLDEESAAAYERHLVPAVFDPWAADLVASVDIGPAARVLDIGCGTGIAARHAAGRVGPDGGVIGIDVNPAMLDVARERAAASGLPIGFEAASAERLPFDDGAFDVVLCQQALQFFDDRPAAVAEMSRVLRPGGRLALSTCRSLGHQPGYQVLIDVLTRHVGVDAAAVIRSPYALGEREAVRALLGRGGLVDVRLRIAVWPARFPSADDLLAAETMSSPLAGLLRTLDDEVRSGLLQDLTLCLEPHADDEGIVFPFETLIATATAQPAPADELAATSPAAPGWW